MLRLKRVGGSVPQSRHPAIYYSFRDISRYLKERNVLGSSRGFVERVVASYEAVKVEMVRKYFLSTLKFARLYSEGATAYNVNARYSELRKQKKGHRGAAQFEIDHSKKVYKRDRM